MDSHIFCSEYASKSYQDINTGNLMKKQGSFWMVLSSALAASPEVVLEAAHFPQFFEVRIFWPPYLSWLICKMACLLMPAQGTEVPASCNTHDSMSWKLLFKGYPTSAISLSSPYFGKNLASPTPSLHPCSHCGPPSSTPAPLGGRNNHLILEVIDGEIDSI